MRRFPLEKERIRGGEEEDEEEAVLQLPTITNEWTVVFRVCSALFFIVRGLLYRPLLPRSDLSFVHLYHIYIYMYIYLYHVKRVSVKK